MEPDTATQPDAETADTSQGLSVDDAATAISGILDAKKPPKSQNEATEEPVKEETQETEQEASSEETAETEGAEDTPEGPNLSYIDDLSEATGMSMDDMLNLKVKANVDGEESEITLQEAIKSYQKDQHVNKKSMEVSNAQKKFEQEKQERLKEISAELENVQGMADVLKQYILGEDKPPEYWKDLREADPAEYAARRQDYNDRKEAFGKLQDEVKSQIKQKQEQLQAEYQKQVQGYLAEQAESLPKKIPEWKDSKVAKQESEQIRDWMVSAGFSPEEIASVADARHVSILRKAMLYDQGGNKAVMKEKKVVPLNKPLKPGTKPANVSVKSAAAQAAIKQLRQSGHIDDAAAAISALGIRLPK